MNRLWIVLIVIVIGLLVMGQFIPITMDSNYYCPYCRARLHRSSIYLIPASSKVEEGPMSRYYKYNVERHHQHIWKHAYSNQQYLLGCCHSDGALYGFPMMLPEDTEIAILHSIPTPARRKAFVDRLWKDIRSNSPKDYRAVTGLIFDAREAYRANPKRNDWLDILKKHGYTP